MGGTENSDVAVMNAASFDAKGIANVTEFLNQECELPRNVQVSRQRQADR